MDFFLTFVLYAKLLEEESNLCSRLEARVKFVEEEHQNPENQWMQQEIHRDPMFSSSSRAGNATEKLHTSAGLVPRFG